MNIKMCGTKTCEKCRFLMGKGTKMALKPMGNQSRLLFVFQKIMSFMILV